MSSPRPLPTVIGPAENALRALLTSTLSSTRIATYEGWVIVNAANGDSDAWRPRVADGLKIDLDGVAEVVEGLRAVGLLDDRDALTPLGRTDLTEARSAVAATTSLLTEGISESDQEVVRAVLDHMRRVAEDLIVRSGLLRSATSS